MFVRKFQFIYFFKGQYSVFIVCQRFRVMECVLGRMFFNVYLYFFCDFQFVFRRQGFLWICCEDEGEDETSFYFCGVCIQLFFLYYYFVLFYCFYIEKVFVKVWVFLLYVGNVQEVKNCLCLSYYFREFDVIGFVWYEFWI